MVLLILQHRFHAVQPELVARIGRLRPDQLRQLARIALEATSLATITEFLSSQADTETEGDHSP
ncbi:MAG: DUF4351 domain-containing protein [Chloroflexi bacterium]|nr:DUF4351 domain-containing protein [Chloroflexota bacterium]MCI0577609.1 DUF4351 domain-containing protein [Chloroflexota bacterium]MCI0644171.1 DUF4351 domain-containing protein [Chloroflexota bacterium]MCI0725246.1 DUF4351 domain-containing protein [Chloroflexota bacterium]